MSIDITGEWVLVIGATGGIGRATCRAFTTAAAKLTAAGLPGPALDGFAEDIGAVPAALDILDIDPAAEFFASREPFDHVVVAAASTKTGSVTGLSLDDAKAAMESKFWGAYRIAHAARITDHGSLTLISGMLAHKPSATSMLQGAINATLEGLVRGLALERAPVRVNAVSPGLINTPLHNGSPEQRQAMFDKVAARLPARRIGQPEDVAQAIVFAASNPFVTGTIISVDGSALIGAPRKFLQPCTLRRQEGLWIKPVSSQRTVRSRGWPISFQR